MLRKSVKKTGSVKMRLCRPHFSNFADLFRVLDVLAGLWGVLLGALGGHKTRLKSNMTAQHGALGPPAGPGRLPGTILVCFSWVENNFRMIFGMDFWVLSRTAKTGFELSS